MDSPAAFSRAVAGQWFSEPTNGSALLGDYWLGQHDSRGLVFVIAYVVFSSVGTIRSADLLVYPVDYCFFFNPIHRFTGW